MATSDFNFTNKFWSLLELFLKKCFITGIFLQYFITVRTLDSLGELSKIFDYRYSLTEAATEKCSLKMTLHLITYKLCSLK